jgi:hypothetical protein
MWQAADAGWLSDSKEMESSEEKEEEKDCADSKIGRRGETDGGGEEVQY